MHPDKYTGPVILLLVLIVLGWVVLMIAANHAFGDAPIVDLLHPLYFFVSLIVVRIVIVLKGWHR